MRNPPSLFMFVLFFAACVPLPPISTPVFAPTSTQAATTTPFPTQSPVPSATSTLVVEAGDSGWITIQPGMEQRKINVRGEDGALLDKYLIVRIDPDYYRFEIHYDNILPKNLRGWASETQAQVVVNGGYFREEDGRYFPTGLFILNAQSYGESFGDFAGMFAVDADQARLRWLRSEPYLDEPVQFALQSFPMLVRPGGEIGFSIEHEDNIPARRTVIAVDRSGKFILFASAHTRFTLHQLGKYLVSSDLDLDAALNLDGGPSTGLYVSTTGVEIPSRSELPIVITVHAK